MIKTFKQYGKYNEKLLVLDLDNTLISAIHEEYVRDCIDYPKDFMALDDEYFVSKRPHLDKFMKYAFDNWTVALWTAATEPYAKEILTKSGVDVKRFKFMKFKEDCTKYIDDHYSSVFIKDLNKIKDYDLSNIIIVDDKESSAKYTPYNLIEIYPYISFVQEKDDYLLMTMFCLCPPQAPCCPEMWTSQPSLLRVFSCKYRWLAPPWTP